MSVYDELIQFQTIPNAFYEWRDYRNALTGYLLQKARPSSSLAVFGAGYCNDIDLSQLITHFSSVTLFDSDTAAMEAALRQYHLTNCPDIHLKTVDFTGITPDDYRAFGDELSSLLNVRGIDTDIHVLADYALFKLECLYQKAKQHTLNFGVNEFDYAVCFGVHSQINNMTAWIWSAFCANLAAEAPAVSKCIMNANDWLIPRLNDAILAAARDTAFVGCEFANSASYGSIQGASQCITDLKARGCVLCQSLLPWNFDERRNIIYQMLIQEADCRDFPKTAFS